MKVREDVIVINLYGIFTFDNIVDCMCIFELLDEIEYCINTINNEEGKKLIVIRSKVGMGGYFSTHVPSSTCCTTRNSKKEIYRTNG